MPETLGLPWLPRPTILSCRQRSNAITRRRGLDAAIVTAPSDAAVRQALELVRGGGQVLIFAHTRRGSDAHLDLSTVCVDEKDLLGSYSADCTLQNEAAHLVFRGKLDVSGSVTHRFPLIKTADAIRLAMRPTPETLKIVIDQESNNASETQYPAPNSADCSERKGLSKWLAGLR